MRDRDKILHRAGVLEGLLRALVDTHPLMPVKNGHGWVRVDEVGPGATARCGGPKLCEVCKTHDAETRAALTAAVAHLER